MKVTSSFITAFDSYTLLVQFPSCPNLYIDTERTRAVFSKLSSSPNVKSWMQDHRDAMIVDGEVTCEAFPPLRLNEKCFGADLAKEFRQLLSDSILSDPPHGLEWLRCHPGSSNIRELMTDGQRPFVTDENLVVSHQHDVLALRGLLALDLLPSCLGKRHRDDYGINRDGDKCIAIPFRGDDVPAPRSEFAQPDVAVSLSYLSYYSDGLSRDQVSEAFRVLLPLGEDSQRNQYKAWYLLSQPRMPVDD